MSYSIGIVIESLVAVMLILTIGYCRVLNTRLKRLRSDEHSMKAMIGELITATEIAERAIGGLKLTVRDCDENFGFQLTVGKHLSARLAKQIAAGDEIFNRLSQIALAARPPRADLVSDSTPAVVAPRMSNAQATLAAAQAFSERRRDHGLAA